MTLDLDRGFELLCPVSEIYNHTSADRLQLIEFYGSELGQAIHSWRREVYLLSVLIYYNCKTGNKLPKEIKHMLRS